MAIAIPTNQILSMQQIEAVVAGPDGANRLYTVTGQLNVGFRLNGQADAWNPQDETYTALIGPVFVRRQFISAIASASLAGTSFWFQGAAPYSAGWNVTDYDADWDDNSGQVRLMVGVSAQVTGANNSVTLGAVAFHATILAEM